MRLVALLLALVAGLAQISAQQIDITDIPEVQAVIELAENLKDSFAESTVLEEAGLFELANGAKVRVMSPRAGLFFEALFRFNLEFNKFNSANFNESQAIFDTFVVPLVAFQNKVFGDVVFIDAATSAGAVAGTTLGDLAVFIKSSVANNGGAAVAAFSTAIVADPNFLDAQDIATNLISALTFAEPGLAKSPSVACIADKQCIGAREGPKGGKFDDKAPRKCVGVDANGNFDATAGVDRPFCNRFVALFSIKWLLSWILLGYIILILWALYWIYPALKRRICKRGGKGEKGEKSVYSDDEQLIINTLATQCASAENLLFQATDLLKQAKNMQSILAVEVKRESRIMIMTCEYFQAVCAVLVSLTHQYLDKKTFTPGEKFNLEDPAVRALQLEVLNYVKSRLALAFQSESMTEKSLLRIGEAYAILKKVSDSLVFVGFSYDKEVDAESLGDLRTPVVDLTENAFFLSGMYQSPTNAPGSGDMNGRKVCVPITNSDTRDYQPIPASSYLANSAKPSKYFDAKYQIVEDSKTGNQLAFAPLNAGVAGGDGTQFFIRTFWGPEVAAIQQEASSWLRGDGALEAWLERERLEREGRAAPVVKRGAKRRRRRRNKDAYADKDDTTTEYTEASGWSVDENNTFVYNVEAVVKSGLGISGKAGMPYDKVGEKAIKKGSRLYQLFEKYMPNYAEWPKFFTFVFIIMPIAIAAPMFAKIGKGAAAIDIDGNALFKARPAGFGISYLGVAAYYFMDGFIPDVDQLQGFEDVNLVAGTNQIAVDAATAALATLNIDKQNVIDNGIFGIANKIFISNADAEKFFLNDFNGANARNPDVFTGEVQAGILSQNDATELAVIRNQQLAQEVTTILIYAFMHNAAYFFGIIPITLVRESLELIARRFPIVRQIYPMAQWRELHMIIGLWAIFCVLVGALIFCVVALTGIGRSVPFAGLAGDPNIANFFDMNANVLYLRELLLPAVPLLLLMKYASRGPPAVIRKYAPSFITKNYWEICYFLHYLTALTAIIVLVIYRPQVFYWMGATWGFIWGGNKIVRILRTRKCTIKQANLVSYTVEDKRNNAKKRSDVLRITLNVPSSFPSSSRGQACWLTCPEIDIVAHPFTLAKVPTETDKTIMFHIGVKYIGDDDIISYARPDAQSLKPQAVAPPPSNPDELPLGWKTAVDPESGQTYYYNSIEKRTTWTRPRNNAVGKMFDGIRGITTRLSANLVRRESAFGATGLNGGLFEGNAGNTKMFQLANRATWTQRFANLGHKLEIMDPDLRRNAMKNFPVYVSAPLGTSMDDCLLPSLPGSIIITTQNGLPAAESSVRWLLAQGKTKRPKFHFFVSVSREVNDALSVVETLRDNMCESVLAGNLDIEGLNGKYAHMCDWLGVYINLTRRKPSQIEGDRDMLMRSLNPPAAPVSPQQLEAIDTFIKYRVNCGRLPFDRFLARTQQMVEKRTGAKRMAVGYCGSAKVAYEIRSACRALKEVKFDGEYI